MFYLLCFSDDSFSVHSIDEQALAEEVAEGYISKGLFCRVVVCEKLCECVNDDFVEKE